MNKLSSALLAETVLSLRKSRGLSQAELAQAADMNRSMLSRLEQQKYMPSIDQLQKLSEILGFEPSSLFVPDPRSVTVDRTYRIAVAGTGYVGLSLAVLLSQHHEVTAVDILPEKVDTLNRFLSPIQDEYIEKYLSEAQSGKRTLHLTATLDAEHAYAGADFVIVAAPTNYDPKTNFFDCSAVETVIRQVLDAAGDREEQPVIVIKFTVPDGYTGDVK